MTLPSALKQHLVESESLMQIGYNWPHARMCRNSGFELDDHAIAPEFFLTAVKGCASVAPVIWPDRDGNLLRHGIEDGGPAVYRIAHFFLGTGMQPLCKCRQNRRFT
ncbi:hypothetical protein AGR2A_Lc30014 [Agrobacterium genomosp. 2 str. CFBP 5494]|uniref:Uncharacterized protein n=1 Tax=Agrobacterium genomosp. 2 str. CFBP 5494 TaxID=1183436 RepID=A0A9W5B3Z0_9HYPH|nr:hypothetical protein AGR2A_Lc30014 [Agrobacterium genomosp. 2 str. CFBP 5494]